MSSVEHDRSVLGAYALGALDPAEERSVHAHVSTCAECQRELAEFADLRLQLDQVPPEAFLDGPPEGGDFLLQNTLRRVRGAGAAAPRPRRSPMVVAAAVLVVAAAALGGGIVIGRQTAPETVAGPPATSVPAGTVTAEGTDPSTGASMTVSVEPRAGWVWVNANIKGVPAGLECELLIVPKGGGDPRVAGSWVVSAQGEEKGLRLEGTASIEPGDVESVQIVTTDGERMVSVDL